MRWVVPLVFATCLVLTACGQVNGSYYSPPETPASAGSPAQTAPAQTVPTPSPWTTECPQGTVSGDSAIGLCVGAADGYPAACQQPQTVACEHDMAVFSCVTQIHDEPADVYGKPNNAVYNACDANPQVQPGSLGIETQDAPSDYTVSGCEIINVLSNSAAASAGLVGADNRTDPVGDVIFGLTIGGQYTAIPNCAALTTALRQTVPGTQVSVSYDHRVVQFLIGSWKAEASPVVTLQ